MLVLIATTACVVVGCAADAPNAGERTASVANDVAVETTRAWSDEERPRRPAAAGEEAPVRGYRLGTFDPRAPMDDDDSPLVPPKLQLSESDQTVGLDR